MGVDGRPGPPLRELEGEGRGARRRVRARLDDPQAVAPVRAGRRVLQHRRGPRPAVAGRRPGARATARAGSSRSTSATWRRSSSARLRATRRTIGGDVRARRAALLDVPRDHARGPDARWASAGVIVPMPVPLIRLVAGASEVVRLPFPVATDQLRQLRLDNIGPLDAHPGALRVRAAADGGRPRLPAQPKAATRRSGTVVQRARRRRALTRLRRIGARPSSGCSSVVVIALGARPAS